MRLRKGVMSQEEPCKHRIIVMFINSMSLYSLKTAAIHVVTGSVL